MPLQRQVISWPLTGGIDTKNAPLMIQPGSHITLDNVRQERTNEWRARNGTNRSALDDMPQSLPPLLVGAVGKGSGLVALTAAPPVVVTPRSSLAVYSTTGTAHWQRVVGQAWSGIYAGSFASSPMVIQRRVIIPMPSQDRTISYASDLTNGFYVTEGRRVLQSLSDGVAIGVGSVSGATASSQTGAPVQRKRAVFGATNYVVFTCAPGSANVDYIRYNTDGAKVGVNANIGTDCAAANQFIDAIKYPGATTITIVYRNNAGGFRIIEYNDTTDTIASTVAVAQNCDNCISLLPDPDSSGVRFVAVSSATPETRVLRCTSVGVVTTNELQEAVASTQIAGCGYAAGAGYLIVYQTATGLRATKKRSGAISAAVAFSQTNDTRLTLHSNGWRETGDDQMRFVYAFHGPTGDAQDSYFVGMFPYDDGATINPIPEAMARILPLEAGPALVLSAALPQAIRIATRQVEIPLLRLNRSGQAGSTPATRYSADAFRFTDLSTANITTLPIGTPKLFNTTAFFPSGCLLEASDGHNVVPHGLGVIPPKPTLTPSTGAGTLNLLAVYQYLFVLIAKNDGGEEWRSPPSIPATVTLTGTQNTVTVTPNLNLDVDHVNTTVTVECYRTKGNGSQFQKISSDTKMLNEFSGFTVVDVMSDATLNGGEFVYTAAELSTVITPPFSHVEPHGDRAWGIHRDYRNTLWPSKTISNGRSPEWANELQLSIVDEEGDLTNIASMDDKLIAFKASAIYVVTGDGLNNGGAGSAHTVTRIDSDVGAIIGSPVISTGQEVYFVSARGIYVIDRSLQVSFVGAPVDQYLNQPLIQTKEVVIGGVFSPATNEVRFQTTNYRLVYDRLRGIWYRDTGAGMQNVVATCMVGTKQALFKSDGTMHIEADHTIITDNGAAYSSIIRSAWVRPSGTDGRVRLYMARVIMTRSAAGGAPTPTLFIYYNNDDTIVEQFSPPAGLGLVNRISAQPRRHRCSAFSIGILLSSNDDTVRLDAWGAEVGSRPGAFRNNSGTERWA